MSDNSWYENGEKPTIGWHGECTYGSRFAWRECVILPRNKIAIFADNFQKIEEIDDSYSFRPIKTERELAIEEMAKVMGAGPALTYMPLAAKLYDAGYRKNES